MWLSSYLQHFCTKVNKVRELKTDACPVISVYSTPLSFMHVVWNRMWQHSGNVLFLTLKFRKHVGGLSNKVMLTSEHTCCSNQVITESWMYPCKCCVRITFRVFAFLKCTLRFFVLPLAKVKLMVVAWVRLPTFLILCVMPLSFHPLSQIFSPDLKLPSLFPCLKPDSQCFYDPKKLHEASQLTWSD